MQLCIAKEKVVEEFVPGETSIFGAGSLLDFLFEFAFAIDIKSSHELRILGQLIYQFALGHISVAFKHWVVMFTFELDGVEDPLEQEEGHFVFVGDTQ